LSYWPTRSFFWGVLRHTPQTPPSLRGSESRFAPSPSSLCHGWCVTPPRPPCAARESNCASLRACRLGFRRQPLNIPLLRLFVCGVLPAEATELAELQPFRGLLLVLRGVVVPALALRTLEDDVVAHLAFFVLGGAAARFPTRESL